MEPLKFEIEVKARVERVWCAWIETNTITEWFSPEANVEPRLGGAFELFFDPQNHDHQSTKGCVITVFKPNECLSFSWKGPDQFASFMNNPPLTHVKVDFQEKNDETQLFLMHYGWGKGKDWSEARDWHKRAWEEVLTRLKSFLSS